MSPPSPAFEGRKALSAYGTRRAPHEEAGATQAVTTVGCVVGGTQKGGTTALASYLFEHPEMCVPDAKEVHFFDSDWLFDAESVDYPAYHAKFRPTGSTKTLCDATPIYMYWEPAPARIRQYNPAMKWIVVLRDPIERAYSHWNMQRAKGRDTLDFAEAIRTEASRCATAHPRQHPWWSYADRGHYVRQLDRILGHFPREQLLILRSEDLREDPSNALAQVAAFLAIAPFGQVARREVNAIPHAASIDPHTRAALARAFESDVHELQRRFGIDCRNWLRV